MDKLPTDIKNKLQEVLKLFDKDHAGLLAHVVEMNTKFEEMSTEYQKLQEEFDALSFKLEALKPVKGTDYLTENEVNDFKSSILESIPTPDPIDEPGIIKRAIAHFKKTVKMPKDGMDGKDAEVNHQEIANMVIDMIDLPENGKNGRDGKDGSSDTPEQLIEKLKAIPGWQRIDKNFLPGPEKFTTQMELDYAISKLRNQVSFLINKVEGLVITPGGGGTLTPETPTGTIDGNNTAFHVNHTPIQVFQNGQYQNPNVPDYTFNSGTGIINFTTPPLPGDNLITYY